jgi:isoquinoline 1-oxidoreductase beta subunit
MDANLTRRSFLTVSATLAGGLLIRISPLEAAPAPRAEQLGVFVRIDPAGPITIGARAPEIGQGVKTALPMLIAEELDVDWSEVVVEQLPYGAIPADNALGFDSKYGPQQAGGSTNVKYGWTPLRQAGAKVRRMLVDAAAEAWGVGAGTVRTEAGRLIHPETGARHRYGEFASAAAKREVPAEEQPLKSPDQFRIIGRPIPIVDTKGIVTGSEPYGIDCAIEGMVFASVAHCPFFEGDLASVDDTAARAIPGVLDVFRLPPAENGFSGHRVASVVVIAHDTWTAFKGKRALKIEWKPGPWGTDSSARLEQRALEAFEGTGQVIRRDGDPAKAIAESPHKLTADYYVPHLSHATLEPQNVVIDLQKDTATVFMSTQVPQREIAAISAMTGIRPESITFHLPRSGGGFGRRLQQDVISEAVLIAQRVKRPVKVVWTREDDMRNDFYRPAGVQRISAGFDDAGKLTGWSYRSAATDLQVGRGRAPAWIACLDPDAAPAGFLEHYEAEFLPIECGLARGFWRGPQPTFCTFAIQSFFDEVAAATGQDPLAFRLALLEKDRELDYRDHGGPKYETARVRRVLQRAAEKIGYGREVPKEHGIGVAASFVFGGYAAHALEVSVREGQLAVERCVVAIDVGRVVNPSGLEGQIISGTIDGLSAALSQRISVADGQVEQSNFTDYPLLQMAGAPNVEVEVIEGGSEPQGAGEMGVPTVAPALANAVHSAIGIRIRRLPLLPELARAMA